MQTYYPFVWIAFMLCLFLMWFFTQRANHKERMLMIDKGLDPESIKKKKNDFTFPWFMLAAIIIGLGIGLLIISILIFLNLLEKGGNTLPLAILGLCGGIAMLVATNLKSGKNRD